jgi:hypothetical protein
MPFWQPVAAMQKAEIFTVFSPGHIDFERPVKNSGELSQITFDIQRENPYFVAGDPDVTYTMAIVRFLPCHGSSSRRGRPGGAFGPGQTGEDRCRH